MDVDRYITRNEATWQRMESLLVRARRGPAQLNADELDEVIQLYQRVSAHLSYVRTEVRDPALRARLTSLVGEANGLIYGTRSRDVNVFVRFFAFTFPGAVYHCRRQVLVAALLFFVPALALGTWLTLDRAALDTSATKSERVTYVEDQFEQYYSDQPHPVFFAEVTTNNITVAFLAFALGAITAGIGGAWILLTNGAMLGIVSAWMITEGDTSRFFGFILPHGALELTAIVIAGAAGLRVGWSYVAPGDRTRAEAARDEGQRAVTIALGLITMFVLAGLVEGFITGSGLSTFLRVGIGLALWALYVLYLVIRGRAATARGMTGLLGEQPRTWLDEPVWVHDRDLVPESSPRLA